MEDIYVNYKNALEQKYSEALKAFEQLKDKFATVSTGSNNDALLAQLQTELAKAREFAEKVSQQLNETDAALELERKKAVEHEIEKIALLAAVSQAQELTKEALAARDEIMEKSSPIADLGAMVEVTGKVGELATLVEQKDKMLSDTNDEIADLENRFLKIMKENKELKHALSTIGNADKMLEMESRIKQEIDTRDRKIDELTLALSTAGDASKMKELSAMVDQATKIASENKDKVVQLTEAITARDQLISQLQPHAQFTNWIQTNHPQAMQQLMGLYSQSTGAVKTA